MSRGHIAHESYEHVILVCGHKATSHAVTIYPTGKRLYRCRECGVLKARKRGRTR